MGIETPLCTNPARARTASDGGPILRNAPSTGRSARNPGETARKDPRKGTTPARGGGEEARVVVHQPRGVGLIQPRLRPSNAYYTHDSRQ
ncbi:hypothetical protein EGA31_18325 [Mycobacterium avium subsp. paratuberculosis]|nr:hypothetical protein EGA31_18325 [Mycobacterium avium subsp. paratuberculosis]